MPPIKTTIEQVGETPIAKEIGKTINAAAVGEATKTRLKEVMGVPAQPTIIDVAKTDVHTQLKNFRDQVLKRPEQFVETIRNDIRANILSVLSNPTETYDLSDEMKTYEAKFPLPAAPPPRPATGTPSAPDTGIKGITAAAVTFEVFKAKIDPTNSQGRISLYFQYLGYQISQWVDSLAKNPTSRMGRWFAKMGWGEKAGAYKALMDFSLGIVPPVVDTATQQPSKADGTPDKKDVPAQTPAKELFGGKSPDGKNMYSELFNTPWKIGNDTIQISNKNDAFLIINNTRYGFRLPADFNIAKIPYLAQGLAKTMQKETKTGSIMGLVDALMSSSLSIDTNGLHMDVKSKVSKDHMRVDIQKADIEQMLIGIKKAGNAKSFTMKLNLTLTDIGDKLPPKQIVSEIILDRLP